MAETLVEALGRLHGLLAAFGSPHALVGGAAINARVRARYTADLDVVLLVPAARLEALLALGPSHGYVLDPADRDLAEAGLLRFWGPPGVGVGIGVDLIFAQDPFAERLLARATPLDLGPCSLQVATVEDLLLMKLEANRPVDLDDAIAIRDAWGDTLDRPYLRAEAARLELLDRLDAFLD